MARRPFSKPIHAKEEKNGPPCAKQGLLTAKPKSSFLINASRVKRDVQMLIEVVASQLAPRKVALG